MKQCGAKFWRAKIQRRIDTNYSDVISQLWKTNLQKHHFSPPSCKNKPIQRNTRSKGPLGSLSIAVGMYNPPKYVSKTFSFSKPFPSLRMLWCYKLLDHSYEATPQREKLRSFPCHLFTPHKTWKDIKKFSFKTNILGVLKQLLGNQSVISNKPLLFSYCYTCAGFDLWIMMCNNSSPQRKKHLCCRQRWGWKASGSTQIPHISTITPSAGLFFSPWSCKRLHFSSHYRNIPLFPWTEQHSSYVSNLQIIYESWPWNKDFCWT